MSRTVVTDLDEIVSMLENYTGLRVTHDLIVNVVSEPILYNITFRAPIPDPGDNYTIVGTARLAVNLAHEKLYCPFLSRPETAHRDLIDLVDGTLAVYYDNLLEE